VIRCELRLIGNRADVPIEPDSQTHLLDACLEVEGVIIAGVPGAGGYDAIFCVICDDGDGDDSTLKKLVDMWEQREERVCPLLAREESDGLLLEDPEALLA
jgi:phosphomevalonate kinase